MAKYIIKEESLNDDKAVFLQCIANEIAETNRLKRIELEIYLLSIVDKSQFAKFDIKIIEEDRA